VVNIVSPSTTRVRFDQLRYGDLFNLNGTYHYMKINTEGGYNTVRLENGTMTNTDAGLLVHEQVTLTIAKKETE